MAWPKGKPSARRVDLSGKRFTRLLAIEPIGTGGGKVVWLCRCDCGQITKVRASNLGSGAVKSCGCLNRQRAAERQFVHGLNRTPEHRIWTGLWSRCTNPNVKSYPRYGGRGIVVCERWRDFKAFLDDLGPRPSHRHSVDRIDNDGPYAPSNCRWATSKEQRRNSIQRLRFIECFGDIRPLVDWCEEFKISYKLVQLRLNRLGWTPEKALTTPARPQVRHG